MKQKQSDEVEEKKMRAEFALPLCVFGIYLFYLAYSYFQEAVVNTKFSRDGHLYRANDPDHDGEIFTYTFTLILGQCFASFFVGFMMLKAKYLPFLPNISSKENDGEMFSLLSFWIVGFAYVGAMYCSNRAILYVSHPAQVLAKSCKPVPVMIFSIIFAKRRYPLMKYFTTLLITLGVYLFMAEKARAKVSINDTQNLVWGIILLLGSLFFDGITGSQQEKYSSKFRLNSSQLMCYTNLWGGIFLFIAAFLSGELYEAYYFIIRNPTIVMMILPFCFTSALGQNFIFYTITRFGAVACSLITTTRKLWTVLLSVFLFKHHLTNIQWFSVVLVFSFSVLDIFLGRKRPTFQERKKGIIERKIE